ncbi:MAG TPA: DUF47 family protein [Polyangiaceae bacterium]|jgi:hypothetical protein|nr:DUF47 family protein [Polyangiaceae bacterium]
MKFLPNDPSFFDDFEKQGQKTLEGCRALLAMAENLHDSEARAREIKRIEEECDSITHHVVEKLHTAFITPLDRNDIYRLITKMDDIMDHIEAAADRLALYEMRVPTKELVDLVRVLVRACEEVKLAVSELRNLKNPSVILEKCRIINSHENEADALLRGTLARLFREEKDAIEIIKWKEVYEHLESAADRCEDVANIIEGVVLENS